MTTIDTDIDVDDTDDIEAEYEEEENLLLQEFADLCDKVNEKIQFKIDQARVMLREAEKIAEAHSVPFSSNISPIRNVFVPKSFSMSKFHELDTSEVCDAAGVYGEYIEDMFDGDGGWLHSAVC